MFSYPLRTALAVGLSMAQIGEFAFVLLSVASHQGLLAYQVYMLLMGAPRSANPYPTLNPTPPAQPAALPPPACLQAVVGVSGGPGPGG